MSIERLLWEEDATALAQRVNKGEISPAELVDAAIGRAEQTNPEINAVATPLYDAARKRAASVDRSLPLAGVPMALKDLEIAMAGVPIHAGSREPAFTPDFDSTLTVRFLAAGMVPIAISTTPEFGLRYVTESEAFGITRNPWNTQHVTGGSSGGSAALVAAGIVPVSHASDGGGSIRVPSACNGLVGLKPSRGRIPATPLASEAWFGFAMQHAVTRSVRDSARLLDIGQGPDRLSPYVAAGPSGTFAAAAARDPGKLRIGVYRKSPLRLRISPETTAALDAAAGHAQDAGHAVEEIDLPFDGRDFMADYANVVSSAVAGQLRLDAERVGRPVIGDVERSTRTIARLGEILSGGEVTAALERLQRRARQLLAATAAFDAVLMPIIAHPPLECGSMDSTGLDDFLEEMLDRLRLARLLKVKAFMGKLIDQSFRFTHWPAIQNVTGQPAIALPVHVTAKGLPLGIQAVGRIGEEETLLSLAAQMESQSGWLGRRAPFHVPQ